jgi:hypothetical protein
MPPRLITIAGAVMSDITVNSEADDEPTIYELKMDVFGGEEVLTLDAYLDGELLHKRGELFRLGHQLWLQCVLNGSSIFVLDAWFVRSRPE